MADLHLDLIDGFEVRTGTRSVRLPLGTQRVLAFLGLHDRAVRRAHVAGALWLDADEDKAGACLRSALWRVHRSHLALVDCSDGCLRLAPEVVLDVREATEAATNLMDDQPTGRPNRALIAMFSRDLLPDWYDDWAIVARERFRQLRLHALERLCERLTAAGEFDRAIQAGLAAIEGEPLRESAHIVLIKAHLAESNYVEAVRQYGVYERLVTTELGISPSARIDALISEVRDL